DNDWIDLEEYLGMDLQEYFELSFRGTNEGSQLAGNADLWRTEESYLGRPQDEYIIKYNTTFGSSGFFALPGGKRKRQNMGNILKWDDGLGTTACFWTSSDCNDDRALNRSIKIFSSLIYRDEDRKWRGLSIRCIKD
ncbi:MAG: hypothetical protein HN600_10385, partial [Bacteroidetes bacterium]|nr:hypothetical protein [Bacteroidota bacterium]